MAYLALLVEVLWCALWTLAALGTYAHAASGSSKHHHGGSAVVIVLLAVSLYWGQQVCLWGM